jgi:hypothetical protein
MKIKTLHLTLSSQPLKQGKLFSFENALFGNQGNIFFIEIKRNEQKKK